MWTCRSQFLQATLKASLLVQFLLVIALITYGADPSPTGPFEPLRQHATVPEAELSRNN